jgi:sugar/nucleoside kinase (ribokinase family)
LDGDPLDIVIVGAASRDVAADDPRGWRLGGAATYCSLTAARLGLRVGCLLGLDAEAVEGAGAELEMLTAAGTAVSVVQLDHGPVFENIERDGHRRQRWLSRSDAVPSAALPAEWRNTAAWLLGPVAGEVGEEWAAAVPADAVVGVGWQGLMREFSDDGWVRRVAPRPSALLAAAGLVVASVDDLDRKARLEALRPLAPRAAIVLTAGDGGGMALHGGRLLRYHAARADEVVDPTGAGDVFMAALMAAWLLTGEVATPATLGFAAAAGSCAVEGLGLAGVPTRSQVAERLRGAGFRAR